MPKDLLIAPYGVDKATGEARLPNPTQRKVLQWVDEVRATPVEDFDHIPVLYLEGGNGSGKTRAIKAPAIEILTQIPDIRLLWGRYDFKDLKMSIMDKFFEVLPKELIVGGSAQYHYYDIRQPGKTTARIFFSGLKDLSGLGSQEFAVILISEAHECTLQLYRTIKRRCRQAGMPCMILMESEPPNATHWLCDITNPNHEEFDPDVTKWTISTYENWDNLPQAYRGSLESMSEAAKRKYVHGLPGFSVSGKPFYQGYDHQVHSGEFEAIQDRELLVGWDFGFHFPAVVISQMDMHDRWVLLREFLGRDTTIHKFADFITAQMNTLYPNYRMRHFGDPACLQVNDKSEETSWQILNSKGIRILTKQSTYRARKEIFEKRLSTLQNGRPQILVDRRNCPIICDGFMGGYHYPERREQQEYDNDRFEMPYRDGYYEHPMNAMEYIAVNVFKPLESNIARTRHPQGRV